MARSPTPKYVDNFEFEARFSTESRIHYEEIRNSNISFNDFRPFLDRLPPREVDLLELYYHHRKNQKDIAKMFGITQGAVSSRLARARERLKFLRDIPKLSEQDLREKLLNHFDEFEVLIMQLMARTTCQSRTAKLINVEKGFMDDKNRMTQVKIRHRFEKCVGKLSRLAGSDFPELKECSELMQKIHDNLYMLHEVKLPHFDRGDCAVFSMKV